MFGSKTFLLPLALALAAPAIAKPVAVGSTPAANGAVSKPTKVEVRLSEKVAADSAAIALTMTAMPGMAHHGEMKISGFKTSVTADGRTIVAMLPRALPPGTYSVRWSAGTGADRGEGTFAFQVK